VCERDSHDVRYAAIRGMRSLCSQSVDDGWQADPGVEREGERDRERKREESVCEHAGGWGSLDMRWTARCLTQTRRETGCHLSSLVCSLDVAPFFVITLLVN
jgi:hypothetical protein